MRGPRETSAGLGSGRQFAAVGGGQSNSCRTPDPFEVVGYEQAKLGEQLLLRAFGNARHHVQHTRQSIGLRQSTDAGAHLDAFSSGGVFFHPRDDDAIHAAAQPFERPRQRLARVEAAPAGLGAAFFDEVVRALEDSVQRQKP